MMKKKNEKKCRKYFKIKFILENRNLIAKTRFVLSYLKRGNTFKSQKLAILYICFGDNSSVKQEYK